MDWIPVEECELALFENRLNLPYRIKGLEAHIYEPGYYGQGALLRLRAPDYLATFIVAGTGRIFERQLFPLDGTSAPIHAGNKAARIDIRSVEQAREYAQFFLEFLQAEHGKFRLVDGLKAGWCVEGAEPFEPRPMEVRDAVDGEFSARSLVEYGMNLFEAVFAISAQGYVDMVDDDPIGRLVPRVPH